MLTLEVNLTFHKEKTHDRTEVFNVRNMKCHKIFYEFTSKNNMFSNCFRNQDEDINVQFKRWQRIFTKSIHACFRKVRIQDDKKKPSKMDELMSQRKIILRQKMLSIEDEEILVKIEKKDFRRNC